MSELTVQQHLRSGRTPEDIGAELGINVFAHPTLPLVGFAYDQIESPKTNAVVRECRGLVLERGTWDVVARPFRRFFNVGEDADAWSLFDWSSCTAQSKEDGSLIIVYHYAGEWHANTRGSFGLLPMQNHDRSWREVFWSIVGDVQARLDPAMTYLFELCTVWNKVVRRYPESRVYLLAMFERDSGHEVDRQTCDDAAADIGVRRPDWHSFDSLEAVQAHLATLEATDPTNEGVVLRDRTGARWKAKSKTYVSLHHMHDNGNIAHPRRLVPWAMKDDPAELLVYFPEIEPQFREVEAAVREAWDSLSALWREHHAIADQKAFALAVKHHPFAGILFGVRKVKGAAQTLADLRAAWRDDTDRVAERLFGKYKAEATR